LVIHTIAPLRVVVTEIALIGANIGPILRDIFAVGLDVFVICLNIFVSALMSRWSRATSR
jgi:hypothetical protein